MSDTNRIFIRKASIVIHLLSFAVMVAAFNLRSGFEAGSWLNMIDKISLGLWMLSFYFAFNRTGISKFLTYKVDKLDERELSDYHRALRFAFWIYVFFVFAIMVVFDLGDVKIQIGDAIPMLYLACILPGVYLGWKMK